MYGTTIETLSLTDKPPIFFVKRARLTGCKVLPLWVIVHESWQVTGHNATVMTLK